MLSYVIQEDTTAENASLMGKGRQTPPKAASRPTQRLFRLCVTWLQIGALKNAKIKGNRLDHQGQERLSVFCWKNMH